MRVTLMYSVFFLTDVLVGETAQTSGTTTGLIAATAHLDAYPLSEQRLQIGVQQTVCIFRSILH
jgi:hypothetical protein